MEPITIGLIAAAIQGGSALIGWLMDSGKRDEAARIVTEAHNRGMELNAPTIEKIAYDTLPPETMSMFQADPRVQQAFNASYDKLGQIADNGGLTIEDRAVQNRLDSEAQRNTASAYNRIEQDMAAQGALGSGADIAMRLAKAQDAGSRYHQNSMDAAGSAQKRAYGAIMDRAGLASTQRTADHNEALAKLRIYEYNNNLKTRAAEYNAQVPMQNYNNKVADSNRKMSLAEKQAGRVAESGVGRVVAGVGQAVGSTLSGIDFSKLGGGSAPQIDYEPISSPTPMAADPAPVAAPRFRWRNWETQ